MQVRIRVALSRASPLGKQPGWAQTVSTTLGSLRMRKTEEQRQGGSQLLEGEAMRNVMADASEELDRLTPQGSG
jgi:hypothetical protein